jgi:hypothetical protein
MVDPGGDMLTELGVPPLIAEASRAVHERLTVPAEPAGQWSRKAARMSGARPA